MSDGQGSEPVPEIVPAHEPLLLTIGDIGVSKTWVTTPNGAAPLKDSQWIVRDATRPVSTTPTWAVVCAILFALLCLVGLLFLLVKEHKQVGFIEVTVTSGSLFHVAQIRSTGPFHIDQIRGDVQQAQSLAAAARELD